MFQLQIQRIIEYQTVRKKKCNIPNEINTVIKPRDANLRKGKKSNLPLKYLSNYLISFLHEFMCFVGSF